MPTDQASEQELAQAKLAIRSANDALVARTGDRFELPIGVLIEQRDEAIKQSELLRGSAAREKAAMLAEQDQFITFLMTEHEAKLLKLGEELKSARAALDRLRSVDGTSDRPRAAAGDPGDAAEEIGRLRDLLEAAYAEADETRADAARLQADLDNAVVAVDDVRLALRQEIDAARDDAFEIQSKLDEANRLLEDVRDQARDEAFRFTEELSEARRERDERSAEVRRLRERLADLTDGTRPSMPPPPAAGAELASARTDNELLRKQLIDAKRELSRVARELELSQMRRIHRLSPVPGRDAERAPTNVRKPTP